VRAWRARRRASCSGRREAPAPAWPRRRRRATPPWRRPRGGATAGSARRGGPTRWRTSCRRTCPARRRAGGSTPSSGRRGRPPRSGLRRWRRRRSWRCDPAWTTASPSRRVGRGRAGGLADYSADEFVIFVLYIVTQRKFEANGNSRIYKHDSVVVPLGFLSSHVVTVSYSSSDINAKSHTARGQKLLPCFCRCLLGFNLKQILPFEHWFVYID
jgi:hypothetical protein